MPFFYNTKYAASSRPKRVYLSREEEQTLIASAKKGDCAALNSLLNAFETFIHSIAMSVKHKGALLDLDDLEQCGRLGLVKAIKKFDLRKGCRLSAYARWWIKSSMVYEDTKQSRTIHIPYSALRRQKEIGAVKEKLRQTHCREPTTEEIMAALSPTRQKTFRQDQKDRNIRYISSLDDLIGPEEGNSRSSGDRQLLNAGEYKDGNANPESLFTEEEWRANQKILATNIMDALNTLPQRMRWVIRLRFLQGKTLNEIGNLLGVSRERARQIVQQGLRLLKENSALKTMFQAMTSE